MSKKTRKKQKKNIYRATKVNLVDREKLKEKVKDEKIVVGIDVAKKDMFATFMNEQQEIIVTIKWIHSVESELFLELICELPSKELEVAMEPTGTYGDALRYQLLKRGIAVYRVSPKRAHDAAEVYDGVPSLHDAKSGAIIAKLHLDDMSELWRQEEENHRNLGAAIGMMNMYESQYLSNINLLEAQLARYWPELLMLMELTTVTLLVLISTYGSPAMVSRKKAEARRLMRKTGGNFLDKEKVVAVISSASSSIGVPMLDLEREALKDIATEILRLQKAKKKAAQKVERLSEGIESVHFMGKVVGKTTAAVIAYKIGDPLNYESSKSFEKSAGLNLKEKSSGKHQGQLKITKRGSGMARQYLYFAALRLIKKDIVVRSWYDKKVQRDGGKMKMKGIIAVMRKLTRALWYVAQGSVFDSRKLFDVNRLDLIGSM